MKYTLFIFLFLIALFPTKGQASEKQQEQPNQSQKRADLELLRKKYKPTLPQATQVEVEAAFKLVDLYQLNRMSNGMVKGISLYDKEVITNELARRLGNTVRALAFATTKQLPGAEERFTLFMDYLTTEHAIERIPKFKYSSYDDVRKLPANFLSALTVCDSLRKARLISGVKKLIEFDQLYLSPEELKTRINSDYIYNALPHVFICALYNPDNTQAISDLTAFSDYLSSCTQYSPGGYDILKPDGTGFHHKTHYNGYMYSYKTWVEYMGRLKGTVYRIDKDAYQRIRKAVISTYLMATRSMSDTNRFYANSLAGRHPFTGMNINFTQKLFELLIEIGGDIKGTVVDLELASYYNYFFMTQKYKDAPEINLEGFYQFNYSPIGVYRYNNWVATMRCPTTNFWGGELYAQTNRFGRYQSHGTLEILYDGPLENSGYPADNKTKGAGWDWNMPPGSTTVHYLSWEEMMPNQNNKDRFDQKASTTNFAGALSWKDCGLFAAAFDQNDSWGSRRFEPTNLTFCKSVFAFDGMLVSIGNGISAIGDYDGNRPTATNLFQSIGKGENSLIINGQNIKRSQSEIRLDTKKQDIWLITPNATGYYIPSGNDPLVIRYGKQETPGSAGIQKNNLKKEDVAKAYINHGIKPQGKEYCFVVIPGATPQKMEQLIPKLQKSGELFDMYQAKDSVHILKHIPSNTIAYALFAPTTDLSYGYLHSSSTELLIMERFNPQTGILHFALCNPNLHPQSDKKNNWNSTPTHTTLILESNWSLEEKCNEDILSITSDAQQTKIQVVLQEGAPLYLNLKKSAPKH